MTMPEVPLIYTKRPTGSPNASSYSLPSSPSSSFSSVISLPPTSPSASPRRLFLEIYSPSASLPSTPLSSSPSSPSSPTPAKLHPDMFALALAPHQASLHRDQFRTTFKKLSKSMSNEVISEDDEPKEEDEVELMMADQELNFHTQKMPHFNLHRAQSEGLISSRFLN